MEDALAGAVADYGLPGLFLVAALAATILPFSSEAAVVGAVLAGFGKPEVILWASIGNCLGVTLNYGLGIWAAPWVERRLSGSRTGRRIRIWMYRHPVWPLLFSWLPVVGDPLTLAAGLFRSPFVWFVLLVYTLRVLRYWLIVLWI